MKRHHRGTTQPCMSRLWEKALRFLRFHGVGVVSIKVGMKYALTVACDDFMLVTPASTKLLLGRCTWETRFGECPADLCEVFDKLPNL
jgi:hypothetical protein